MVQLPRTPLRLKLATEIWEFEQIHQLNYRTFVEEIPQHPPNAEKWLVDKFHTQNTYAIALRGQHLVGMLAIRNKRPFSLDSKLTDLDAQIPPSKSPAELRLLAVEPEARQTSTFFSLLGFSMQYCLQQGYDLVIISGTTRQIKLYNHLGFKPFGALVGAEGAQYQPMFLTLDAYQHVLNNNAALRKAMQGNSL